MRRSRYTLLINSLINSFIDSLINLKKFRDNFRVYLERAHPAFLTTLVVLVYSFSHVTKNGQKVRYLKI